MLKLSTGHGQEICMEESTTKKWQEQRECIQMENKRPTIGAHITINGQFTHIQNARD